MPEESLSFNIFHKLLLTMIVVALIPLGGLWYISSYKAREDWTTHIFANLIKTADTLAVKVNDWEDMNLRVLRQNAELADIVSMDAARQNPVLKTIGRTYEWAYLIYTIRPDGQNIGRNDDKPALNYADRAYFKQVMSGTPVAREVLVGKTTGKPALILAGPIHDSAKQVAGVLAMAMDLGDISKTVTDTRIGKTGYAILLDEGRKAIAHGKSEKVTSVLQDLSGHPALQAKEGAKTPVFYEEDGRKVVAYAQKLGQGWTLIIQQDAEEAFAPLRQVEHNALLLMLVTLLLVIVVAYVLGRLLADPIRRLTAVADDISRGEMTATIVETQRSDEIGALARAIERMGVSIQMALERLRKKT